MDIQFYGANCLTIATKHTRLVIDDNLSDLGANSITQPGDVAVFTMAHSEPTAELKLLIDIPGEYEVGDISIQGMSVRAHIDEPKQKTATLYRVTANDIRVLVTGHIYPELTDSELEAIGVIDILCIPVGGNGYTLDGVGTLKLIKKIEPKIIIPTHYEDKTLQYPIPQQSLEEALKTIAMEPKEKLTKLRLKSSELGELSQLVVLERV